MGDMKMTKEELLADFELFKQNIHKQFYAEFVYGFNSATDTIIQLIRREFPAPVFKALEERIIQEFTERRGKNAQE